MIPLLKKEFLGLWRSGRVLGVTVVMVLMAISGPAVTKFLPDLIGGQLPEGVEITLPPVAPVDGVIAFLQNAAQIGFLVVILVAMGAVAAERSSGVALMTLALRVRRHTYLLAKAITHAVLVAAALQASGAVAWGYTQFLLGPVSLGRVMAATAFYAVWALVIVSWTLLFSSLLRSQLMAAILALAPLFAFPLLETLAGPGDR